MEKITTPTPSLNRLSPAIVACSVGGTRAVFSTPMTATGSVGLIRAPNTRHQISGTARPTAADRPQNPTPTRSVEATTPIVDRTRICQRPLRRSSMSTCIAPANSRNDSIPSIRASWKSTPSRKRDTVPARSLVGVRKSIARMIRDATAPIMVRATVPGSLNQRRLIQAKPADRTIRTAAVSKAEKAIVIGALPKVRRQKNVLPSANRGRGSGVAAVQSF